MLWAWGRVRGRLSGSPVRVLCALLLVGLLLVDLRSVRVNPSIIYVALLALCLQNGGRRRAWGLGLAVVGLVYAGYFWGARSATVGSRLELFHRTGMLNRTFVACTVCLIGLIARKGWGAVAGPVLPEGRRAGCGYPSVIADDAVVAGVCFLAALVVFMADLLLPLPVNPAILYGAVVVLAGWTQSRPFLWAMTVTLAAFTLVGYLESSAPATASLRWAYLANRGIVVLMLVALAAVVHRSLERGQAPSWSSTAAGMKRVLHVISGINPEHGGPTAALIGLSKSQTLAGKEVTVLSTWTTEAEVLMAATLRQAGVKVILVGPAHGPFQRHGALRREVWQAVARADVVHIHGLWEDIQHEAASAAARLGMPYIMRPCGMLDPWSLAHHRARKLVYMAWRLRRHLNRASAIHLTTAAECEAVARLGLAAPVIVEPLGVDLAEFDPLPEAGNLRQHYPELAGRRCVLFFGRVCEKKGVHLLIEAMARVADEGAMLVIAGPVAPAYRARLDEIVARHRLEARVIFVGMLHGNQRVSALVDCEMFVLPSSQENFGVAVVEAMAAGCPVIVSQEVAIARDIEGWGAGATAPLEPEGLARVIDEWLADASKRRLAGARGREAAFTHFDWRQVAQGWDDHYEYLAEVASRRMKAVEVGGGEDRTSNVQRSTLKVE
jgi:glycosyltransferase involved in cell wall biosynthesis